MGTVSIIILTILLSFSLFFYIRHFIGYNKKGLQFFKDVVSIFTLALLIFSLILYANKDIINIQNFLEAILLSYENTISTSIPEKLRIVSSPILIVFIIQKFFSVFLILVLISKIKDFIK